MVRPAYYPPQPPNLRRWARSPRDCRPWNGKGSPFGRIVTTGKSCGARPLEPDVSLTPLPQSGSHATVGGSDSQLTSGRLQTIPSADIRTMSDFNMLDRQLFETQKRPHPSPQNRDSGEGFHRLFSGVHWFRLDLARGGHARRAREGGADLGEVAAMRMVCSRPTRPGFWTLDFRGTEHAAIGCVERPKVPDALGIRLSQLEKKVEPNATNGMAASCRLAEMHLCDMYCM